MTAVVPGILCLHTGPNINNLDCYRAVNRGGNLGCLCFLGIEVTTPNKNCLLFMLVTTYTIFEESKSPSKKEVTEPNNLE